MSTALATLSNNTGVSQDEITEVVRGMIISSKSQHGAIATNAEMAVVAGICAKYDLNPMTREAHAFVSGGKLQVIIGIDGWTKILNRQPEYDGFEQFDNFNEAGELVSVTTKIYVKNRRFPVPHTEYMDECYQPKSEAWRKYKKRMLTNKSLGQTIRIAFGISDVIDNDEASRIKEATGTLNAPTSEIDYTEIESDFAECADDETLRKSASAWREKLQSTGNWESAKAKVAEMRLNHKNRIEAMVEDEVIVEFDEFTEETAE